MGLLEKIQRLCEERGLSVPKLEQNLGFGRGSIYKWAKSSPTIDKLEKVANYLKVSLDDLLDRGNIFDLGPYIKAEREKQGISEKQMCEKLAISELELKQYEASLAPLTEDLAARIMEIFNLSLPEFLDKYGLSERDIPPGEIQTIAAHHDGEDWTEEELAEIEQFKEFVRMKRKHRSKE